MQKQNIEDKDLHALKQTLVEQESLTRELFELLGTTVSELDSFLRERSRFTPEVWDILETERLRLESKIEKKRPHAKKATLPHIKKHWIQVR